MNEKLEALRSLIEADQERGLRAQGYNPALHQHDCRLKKGRKYVNIDVGSSGKYMVELATGNIYGIKAYGVIHRGHQYGNLDTINEWDWSGFTAFRKTSKAA